MAIKPYKIWLLLKLKLKNENQKIFRAGYVKFTLIEQVFFKKVKSLNYFHGTGHFAISAINKKIQE